MKRAGRRNSWSHTCGGEVVDRIIREAFQLAAKGARDGKPLTEYVWKQWILEGI